MKIYFIVEESSGLTEEIKVIFFSSNKKSALNEWEKMKNTCSNNFGYKEKNDYFEWHIFSGRLDQYFKLYFKEIDIDSANLANIFLNK